MPPDDATSDDNATTDDPAPTLNDHIIRPSTVLTWPTGVALCAGLLALLTAGVMAFNDSLLRLDEPTSEWLGGIEELDGPMQTVTTFGGELAALAIALVGAAVVFRRCVSLALVWVSSVFATMLIIPISKALISRPVPAEALLVDPDSLPGFPSGHTMLAVLALGFLPPLVWVLRANQRLLHLSVALYLVLVGAVCVSRVQLGEHYPIDVVGGLLFGALLLRAAEAALAQRSLASMCGGCPLHETSP